MYEIVIGLYGTAKDLTRIGTATADLLETRAPGASLSIVDGADRHEGLVEQWRATNPGADPGTRAVFELRVGVGGSGEPEGAAPERDDLEALRAEITRLACPDPDHSEPCRVPWDSWIKEG